MTAHTATPSSGTRPRGAESRPAPRLRPAWLDWLDASDPGRLRLRMAVEIVLVIGVVLAAEWLFVRATGALQVPIPAGVPAAETAQLRMLNHALMVIAMMLGAILAMISGFGVSMFGPWREQLSMIGFLPFPLLAMLAVGLLVHVRLLSLALLAVTLTAGTYCRRFGPRGFNGGVLAFIGAFLGFFIQDYVPLTEFGWFVGAVTAALAPWEGGADGGGADGGVSTGGPVYVRSASLFASVADMLPDQRLASRPYLALRDAQLLDGALAEAARWADVPVTDLDTGARRTREPGSAHLGRQQPG